MDKKENLNYLISSKINEHITSRKHRVKWLKDTLQISKESIYRRLKGIIPFQFEEVCIIAQKLDFSIDEIVFGYSNELINSPNSQYGSDGNANSMISLLKKYLITLKKTEEISGSELALTANHLNVFMVIEYENLFKLLILKQLHKTRSSVASPDFSKLQIPEDIEAFRKDIFERQKHISNLHYSYYPPNCFFLHT